ncbi:MAG: lipid A export permease/ATP-binding protein MsbA [Burkholderiaceae bacterium]
MIEKLTFGLFSKYDSHNFMRLLVYVRPYRVRIIYALLAIVGVAATESYLAAFIAPLVNLGFASPQEAPLQDTAGWLHTVTNVRQRLTYLIWGTDQKVWAVPLFFIFLVVVRGICRYISNYLLAWVGAVVLHKLRGVMFDKMLLLPSKYQQNTSSGFITNRFLTEADIAINNASSVFITLTRDTLIVIGLIIVLLYLNWQLSLVVLLMFPILSWLSRYYRDRLKGVQVKTQAQTVNMINTINETHEGHRVVKMFGGQAQANSRFAQANDSILSMVKKLTQALSARSPFSELIASIALAIVMFIALRQSQAGVTTIGEFMAFIVAMLQMVSPIKNLSNISIPMQRMFLAADYVYEFLDVPPESDQGRKQIERVQGNVRFEHVVVQYNDDDKKALNDVSLEVRAGEKVALVGRSGSGKTTLINLLPRFVEPSSGAIYLDGVNITDIGLADLREQFALVSQEVFLFDDTLYQNILYGRPSAQPKEVEEALKAANLWDLVQQSPYGWNLRVGSNGNQLSGGQRQRASIARAILKDAPILILDEATSALDNESERLVQQALDRLMQGRSSIMIAHRLSTIEQADRIIVMNEGRIVEQGSHAELINLDGYYAKLRTLPKLD